MAVLDLQELCGAAALTAPACPWCLMGGVSVLHEGQYPQGCFFFFFRGLSLQRYATEICLVIKMHLVYVIIEK